MKGVGRLSLSLKAFMKCWNVTETLYSEKKFENKQGVFPCKTAHIEKKKILNKGPLPLGLTFRPAPPGPGPKLTHPPSVGPFGGRCKQLSEKEKYCICSKQPSLGKSAHSLVNPMFSYAPVSQ